VVFDDALSPESEVVETRPPKLTYINLDTPENSHGRGLVRRYSPTENRRTTGPGQHSGTQNNLHKRLWTELAWQQTSDLEDTSTSNCRLHRTLQVLYQRASYHASFRSKSLSPLRIFLFTMLRNFIYKQTSIQANLGLPRL